MQDVPRSSLLGRLASSGWFMRRAEVTTTTSMTMLLRDEPFKRSFLADLTQRTGVNLEAVHWFDAEIIHLDGGRVDIEGVDDAGTPLVMIEAKIGHYVTHGQVLSYLEDQDRRLDEGQHGVFVLLVPTSRRLEAELALSTAKEILERDTNTSVTAIVLTWQDVIDTWERALADSDPSPTFDSPHVDLHQFTELCRAFGGLGNADAIMSEWQRRAEIWMPIVDAITRSLSSGPLLPMVTRGNYAPYRYISTDVEGIFVAVGVQQQFADEGQTPLWMRFHKVTAKDFGGISAIRTNLAKSAFAPALRFDGGHVWIALEIDETLTDEQLVTAIVDQYTAVLEIAVSTDPRT